MSDVKFRLLVQPGCPFCSEAAAALEEHFPGQYSVGDILKESEAAGDFDFWSANDHLPLLAVLDENRVIQGAAVAKFIRYIARETG